MSITTMTGDKGETSLWSGERVPKDDLRVEAYGTIDELNSHLGEVKHLVASEEIRSLLMDIQNDLFSVAGQLATRDKEYVHPLGESKVEDLTRLVRDFEGRLGLKGFVIPGGTLASAKLDVCRTVARRAERRVVALSREEEVPQAIRMYVNRLSDLLFIMARFEEHLQGKIEPKRYPPSV